MILFDTIMTIIEDFILSYFSFKILEINDKKGLIFLNAIICFIETFIFNNYITNNFLLLALLIMTNFVIIYFVKNELNLYYFIIPSILIALLLFSNTISLVFVSLFLNISPKDIGLTNTAVIILSLISRVFYFIFGFMFYYVEKRLKQYRKVTLKKDYWIVFCIFTFTFLGAYTILYEAIFYQTIGSKTIYNLLFLFIILIISFFILYYRMQIDHYNHMLISNELLKSHYAEELYKKTNKLSYQILQEKHHMFYILIKIRNLLENHNLDETSLFVNEVIENYQAYELTQTSNVPAFDYNILNYINLLKKDGYNITTIITVENNKMLEDIHIINIIKECIETIVQYTTNERQFDLQLHDSDSYLILKITTHKQNNQLPLLSIKKSDLVRKVDIITNENNEVELRVLFFTK